MAKVRKKKPLGRGLSSLLGENLNVDNLTNTNSKNNLISYQLITCQQVHGKFVKILMKMNYIVFLNQ